ncbi:transglutaminase family protein [Roseiconus nitratireducens]|uniref:Transglutaminase family protein n=1 Tax=Roseiconus nitratireducens TaxID=2605748 RepID=A0A5M6DIB7_9BACT|nr:transglutaminase family protein [Roseiconus nitratireducens]KAA5546116.1 transglutaminase family protein [Roseiconus nitratireducens]
MTRIQIGSELVYDVRQETVFLFNIAASQTDQQHIEQEVLTFDPDVSVESCQVGLEGNRLHRAVVLPCQLTVRYQATAALQPTVEQPSGVTETVTSQMPPEVLVYLNPSRYCESDLLARFAFEEFGSMERGYQRVQAICDWVYDHLDYTPGSTNASTTAADVLLQRTGVCRDYAHLAITLCRGVGIPARYVSGYAVNLQPPDFHGFFEAFLDGAWYLFDPTQLARTTGLVRIGTGRDAADTAFCTLNGDAVLSQKSVWANPESPSEEPTDQDESSAVSTS